MEKVLNVRDENGNLVTLNVIDILKINNGQEYIIYELDNSTYYSKLIERDNDYLIDSNVTPEEIKCIKEKLEEEEEF